MEPILQFFSYSHLPYALQQVSEPFCQMAEKIIHDLPENEERGMALRKLLEAKDCAVRSLLFQKDSPNVRGDLVLRPDDTAVIGDSGECGDCP
jgi:hypothetical protein